jgi:glutamate synthase (NADPH/NADH) small chain
LDGTVVLVGGGLGVAPIFPQLREYKNAGNRTISIVGFRNRDLMFWEDQFREFSDELIVTTDDGSYGRKGFVSHALADVIGANQDVREVVAIGPLPMMKACCEVTRPSGSPPSSA